MRIPQGFTLFFQFVPAETAGLVELKALHHPRHALPLLVHQPSAACHVVLASLAADADVVPVLALLLIPRLVSLVLQFLLRAHIERFFGPIAPHLHHMDGNGLVAASARLVVHGWSPVVHPLSATETHCSAGDSGHFQLVLLQFILQSQLRFSVIIAATASAPAFTCYLFFADSSPHLPNLYL